MGSRKRKQRSASKHKQDDEVYEVESICAKRLRNNTTEYRVKWKGYPLSDCTWEAQEDLNCDELVRSYEDSLKKTSDSDAIDEAVTLVTSVIGIDEEIKDEADSHHQAMVPSSQVVGSADEKMGKRKQRSASKHKQDLYEVEDIRGKRLKNNAIEYRVKWKGYPLSSCTWEAQENLNCDDLVQVYEDSLKKTSDDDAIDEAVTLVTSDVDLAAGGDDDTIASPSFIGIDEEMKDEVMKKRKMKSQRYLSAKL
jgi:Chromo (CHRromatin Organisation MOdifier) domain